VDVSELGLNSQPTVLVTGGTGFLGRALVKHLTQRGEFVRVLGRRLVVGWRGDPRVQHLRGDIAEPETVKAALEGITRVYHLAAATEGDWATYEKVTVRGTELLLRTFEQQGGGRLVFVSSCGNYDLLGVGDAGVIDEDCPLDPNPAGRASYARAKILSERLAQSYLAHPSVKLTIVRPGTIYGPDMANPLVGVALGVLGGRLLVIPGMGRKLLDFVYVDDVVHALVRIMECDTTIGRIYNVVHPEMPTQNEYLRLYRKLSHDRRPVVRIPIRPFLWMFSMADAVLKAFGRDYQLSYKASRLCKSVYYSSKRLADDTGFVPSIRYDKGLELMFQREAGL